ncbi:hypothetical protein J2754_002425 [Halarchaeum solikamskense]|nr:hypothetical protein [Halarchaeum solikamskense]
MSPVGIGRTTGTALRLSRHGSDGAVVEARGATSYDASVAFALWDVLVGPDGEVPPPLIETVVRRAETRSWSSRTVLR